MAECRTNNFRADRGGRRQRVLIAVDQQMTRRLLSMELSLDFAVIQASRFREAVEVISQHSLAAIVCSYEFGGQLNPLELFHYARTRIPQTPRIILADPASVLEAHQAVTTNVADAFVSSVATGVPVLATLRKLRTAAKPAADERRGAPRWPARHLRARVDSDGFFNAATTVVNISRGGVLLDLEDATLNIGQKVQLTFCLSNWRPVRLQCSVLRVQRGGRRSMVAARFEDLDGAGLNTVSIALRDAQRQSANIKLGGV